MARVLIAACALAAVVLSEETEAEAPAAHAPTCADCALFESFEDGLASWVSSADEKYNGDAEVVVRPDDGLTGDHGLSLPTSHRHYGLSTSLTKPFENTDGFVVQYELALMGKLDCGGAYLKLLSEDPGESLVDNTPYSIMFGPDKCGATNKVHVIFRHTNERTGEVEEKHLVNPPTFPADTIAHIYTLVVNTDNTYAVLVDNKQVRDGSLFEDFDPPFQPPEQIADPDDTKPDDWVDLQKIEDVTDEKPEDWDEDAPMFLPDMEAEKPAAWEDDEPEEIADPDAVKPDDWDDDEDGDFEAPLIPNPKCVAAGCGEWQRPEKRNPEYKGKWVPRMVDNPEYKGEWAPQQIPNKAYYVVEDVAKFTPIQAVALEVWVTNKDLVFDNVLIASDAASAAAVADSTWVVRHTVESVKKSKSLLGGEGLGDKVLTFMLENKVVCLVASVMLLSLFWFRSSPNPDIVAEAEAAHKKDDNVPAEDDAADEDEVVEDEVVEEEEGEKEEPAVRRSKRNSRKKD